MNNTSLLELAKKMNIPRRNCLKTKEELEEIIKDTIKEYKEIIFGFDTPVSIRRLFSAQIPLSVWHVWMNFESSKPLIKKYMIKSEWMMR